MLNQFIPPIIYSGLKKIFKKNNLSEVFINIDAKTLRYNTFGELNSDKYFYVIQGHSFAGFFSILQFVLCQLKVADELGMIPVIDYQNFPNTYGKDGLGGNVWEYYFEPVSSYSLDEVYKSKHVFFSPSAFDWSMGRYLRKEDVLYKYFKKYIQIKEIFQKEIDNFYEVNFKGHKVLGVHWRGYEQNIAPGHPYCPTEKQITETAELLMKQYNCDRIFFLTEDETNYKKFMKFFYDKNVIVLSTPYYRTSNCNGYKLNPPPRERHIYNYGKEILIATVLLSKCNGFLCSSSNVPAAAIFMNNNKYEFLCSIDNGLNLRNKFFARYSYFFKSRLPRKFGGLKNKITVIEKDFYTIPLA